MRSQTQLVRSMRRRKQLEIEIELLHQQLGKQRQVIEELRRKNDVWVAASVSLAHQLTREKKSEEHNLG